MEFLICYGKWGETKALLYIKKPDLGHSGRAVLPKAGIEPA